MRYPFRDSRVVNATFNTLHAAASRLGLSLRAERAIGIFLFALASGLSGCTPDRRPVHEAVSEFPGPAATPEALRASIREATRYRDPREGLNAKGIKVLDGEVHATDYRGASHEGH